MYNDLNMLADKKINENQNNYYSFTSSQSFSNINGKNVASMSKYENKNGKINKATMEQYDDGKNSIVKQQLNGKNKYLSNNNEIDKEEYEKQLSEFNKNNGNLKKLPKEIELEDDLDLDFDALSSNFDKTLKGLFNNIGGDFSKMFNGIGGSLFNSQKSNGANYLTDGKAENLIAENEKLKQRIEKLEKMLAELEEKVSKNESSSLNNNVDKSEQRM